MKKHAVILYLALILLGIIISVVLFFVLSNDVSSYNVAKIDINGSETIVSRGERSFDILIAAIKDPKKINEKVGDDDSSVKAEITFFNNDKQKRSFYLYVQSIFKRTAYLYDKGGNDIFKISTDNFTDLFSSEPFNTMLNNTEPPVPRLLIEDSANSKKLAIKGYAFEGKWNYATASGTQTSKEISRSYSGVFSIINDNKNDFSLLLNSKDYKIEHLTIYDTDGEIVFESDDVSSDNIPNIKSTGEFVYDLTVSWPVSPEIDYNGKVIYRFNIIFN